MKDKKWILGLVILVAAIAALSIWGFKKEDVNTENNTQVSTAAPNYFDESAKVQFFYSDSCSWCNKEKEVLQRLGEEGYRVKKMDVGANQNYWTDFKINGTPTFIAQNGDRLEGYREYDVLKAWLDQHK